MPNKLLGFGKSFWEALGGALDRHGISIVFLVFVCYVFYRLTWLVWTKTIQSKDDEIARLVNEKNRYQELFFSERLTSDPEKQQPQDADSSEEPGTSGDSKEGD